MLDRWLVGSPGMAGRVMARRTTRVYIRVAVRLQADEPTRTVQGCDQGRPVCKLSVHERCDLRRAPRDCALFGFQMLEQVLMQD